MNNKMSFNLGEDNDTRTEEEIKADNQRFYEEMLEEIRLRNRGKIGGSLLINPLDVIYLKRLKCGVQEAYIYSFIYDICFLKEDTNDEDLTLANISRRLGLNKFSVLASLRKLIKLKLIHKYEVDSKKIYVINRFLTEYEAVPEDRINKQKKMLKKLLKML